MDTERTVLAMNKFLREATRLLAAWLAEKLPKIRLMGSENWWKACVLDVLTQGQQTIIRQKAIDSLEELDLAALLRVATKNWYQLCGVGWLPRELLDIFRNMMGVRNNWAHTGVDIAAGKDQTLADLACLERLFTLLRAKREMLESLHQVRQEVTSGVEPRAQVVRAALSSSEQSKPTAAFARGTMVRPVATPGKVGMVDTATPLGGTFRYVVFMDGRKQTFLAEQIEAVEEAGAEWLDADAFRCRLSAHQLNHPSGNTLYSLNAARIDFVPYQFRPALKLIRADEPRILIADSVGVGKTIEAGLIIKELEARGPLRNIVIVCPKPLVAERKWEMEMKRFDESFLPMDGKALAQALSDVDRDGGAWPDRWRRAIIPYSILDKEAFEGSTGRRRRYGLRDLDPAPHFDLVIVDEAHTIRNGSPLAEKAFAYKSVKYLCDHATAVVMLTATPLQTRDNDLFTLLNVLRPDVVIDRETFDVMLRPNQAIAACVHAIRHGAATWQADALKALQGVLQTQWGENVIAKDPRYASVRKRLGGAPADREERIRLMADVEALNSFDLMLNRTRRKDIQDFCARNAITLSAPFTEAQRSLHDALLRFEAEALASLHDAKGVAFMMSTLRRQAASCIHGLAPYLKDLIHRRSEQLADEPDLDVDELLKGSDRLGAFSDEAKRLLEQAERLPPEDPKIDRVLEVIREKGRHENNKIILFSTFRHTLAYVRRRLEQAGVRVGQVDGSVPDEARRDLREAFQRPKADSDALDVLLFTEVGSEGLDYQFCDTMINYDLPWNPMRIEQRIGRIDRRGQKSEVVNIYNIITENTVDADIYERCLLRIGVFERSIGECEAILGELGSAIEKIIVATELDEKGRRAKLESIADQKIRQMQALTALEEQQRDLFGFDLSEYTTAKAIQAADNRWIAPDVLARLVQRYLADQLGKADTITGDGVIKTLRLSGADKETLRTDFRALTDTSARNNAWETWDNYLQDRTPTHALTFDAIAADHAQAAFFLTPAHPLVRQAAVFLSKDSKIPHVSLRCVSDELSAGVYPFCVYDWEYLGFSMRHRLRAFCDDPTVEAALPSLLAEAVSAPKPDEWVDAENLSERADLTLLTELDKHRAEVEALRNYRLESVTNSHKTRLRVIERKIHDATNEKIRTMYEQELANVRDSFEAKRVAIAAIVPDIHTTPIATGLLTIVKGE